MTTPGGHVPQGPSLDQVQVELPDRLPALDRGAHPAGSGKACAMEAASWLAGERWSDHPRSVHRSIASVARWVNDALEDDERQSLWPLILSSLDTGNVSGFRLDRRLRRYTRKAGCRAAAMGRPVDAWVEVLDEHRRLTSHEPPSVPVARIEDLSQHLSTTAKS
jgi:hypothetical protein